MKKYMFIGLYVAVLMLSSCMVSAVQAKEMMSRVEIDRVENIYDGDTLRVTVHDWPPLFGRSIPVRVRGVDTPEIRGRCPYEKRKAIAARDFVRRHLFTSQSIVLRDVTRGKYFRIVADVYVDGVNLSETLIKSGHGRAYDGGRREFWCATGDV